MAKEHKCRKCGLTYTGFKAQCQYCHKKTKYGVLNTIMCVIGYLTTIIVLTSVLYYELALLTVASFALTPILITAAIIAIIVIIVVNMLK